MEEKRIYFQPKYVGKFKCDGEKCDAHCCKYWIIDIDKKSYESYEKIESSEKEITSKIKYFDERKGYVALMNEKYACSCLTEDNLCMIQKNFGEKYLSITCQTFPRHISKVGDLFERSLSMTCPVAAELALLPSEMIEFELIEETVPKDSKVHFSINEIDPKEFISIVVDIQTTAIFILQERTLTLDQRLAVLGFFLDKIDELTESEKFSEIPQVIEIYTSIKFITESIPALLSDIKFNPKEFIKILLGGVLETLYGETDVPRQAFEEKIFAAVKNTLDIVIDENNSVSLSDTAEKYIALNNLREEFFKRFGHILENYLVNEFFMSFYPWRLTKKGILHNYAVFIATYKIVELFTFSMVQKDSSIDDKDVVKVISQLSTNIDHSTPYFEKISAEMTDKGDTLKIISAFLQV